MRNLKRVLSLTLASVMLLGMMVIGSSAAGVTKINFADADQIEYNEAVDVMVALEVLEGSGKNFNPKEILTREQAAKIICHMLLGADEAEKLTANSDVFKDVAANRWSAGYIAYCAERKILSGVGGGNFAPDGQLTGVAFGKMLLVALGYDPKLQGYTGSGWALAVGADMVDAKIAPAGVLLSAPMTREQAAQAAFLTLTADMVDYDTRGLQYGDLTIGASKPESIEVRGETENYAGQGENKAGINYRQFCERYFPRLKMTTTDDAFGCPSTQWTYKGAEIGKYADEADLVYTSDVKMETIYKDLGLSSDIAAKNVKFFIDGVEESDGGIKANENKADLDDVAIVKSGAAKDYKVGAKGSTTRVYYDPDALDSNGDGTSVIVSVTNYYLAQATKDYSTKDEDVTLKIWGSRYDNGASISNLTVKNEDVAVSGVQKDDYLIVTLDMDGDTTPVVKSAVVPETVADVTVSSARSDDYVNVGTKYEYNAIAKKDSRVLGQDMMADSSEYDYDGDTYTLYLDPNGYVLGVELVEGDGNVGDYLVVTAGATDNAYDVIVKVMFTDGSKKTITVNEVDKVSATKGALNTVGKFYTFKEKSDGTYDLTTVPNYVAGTTTAKAQGTVNSKKIENDATPIESVNITGTSKTVFIADGKIFTGIKNAPVVDASNVSYVTDKDGRLLIVWTSAKGKSTVDTDELVFILKEQGVQHGTGSDAYYTYDVLYKDEVTTLDCEDGPKMTPGLYEIDSWNSDNQADLSAQITSTKDPYIIGKASSYDHHDGILTIGGMSTYTLTDDAKVYTIDGDTVKTLNAENGVDATTVKDFKDVILVKEDDSKTNSKISVVYLIKNAKAPASVTLPADATPAEIDAALNGMAPVVKLSGSNAVTVDSVPAGKTLETGTGEVTVTGTVNGTVNVNTSGKLVIGKDATVGQTASINVTNVNQIKLADDAKGDGSNFDAFVNFNTANYDPNDDWTEVPMGIPFFDTKGYAGSATQSAEGIFGQIYLGTTVPASATKLVRVYSSGTQVYTKEFAMTAGADISDDPVLGLQFPLWEAAPANGGSSRGPVDFYKDSGAAATIRILVTFQDASGNVVDGGEVFDCTVANPVYNVTNPYTAG